MENRALFLTVFSTSCDNHLMGTPLGCAHSYSVPGSQSVLACPMAGYLNTKSLSSTGVGLSTGEKLINLKFHRDDQCMCVGLANPCCLRLPHPGPHTDQQTSHTEPGLVVSALDLTAYKPKTSQATWTQGGVLPFDCAMASQECFHSDLTNSTPSPCGP